MRHEDGVDEKDARLRARYERERMNDRSRGAITKGEERSSHISIRDLCSLVLLFLSLSLFLPIPSLFLPQLVSRSGVHSRPLKQYKTTTHPPSL